MIIKSDVSEVENALSGTKKSLKSIKRQVLAVISKDTVKAIKTALRSSGLNLKDGTGELLKAYRYKIRKNGSEANVFPKALNADSYIFPKAQTLSYGHTGATVRAKEWNVKPRGFVQEGQQKAKGTHTDEIEKIIQKELDRYWN